MFQEVTLHPMEQTAFELCSLCERANVDTRLSFGCQTNEGGKARWREVEQPEEQTIPLYITAKDDPGQEWTMDIKISETEISCEAVFVGELHQGKRERGRYPFSPHLKSRDQELGAGMSIGF